MGAERDCTNRIRSVNRSFSFPFIRGKLHICWRPVLCRPGNYCNECSVSYRFHRIKHSAHIQNSAD